jgi:hypothetical protein
MAETFDAVTVRITALPVHYRYRSDGKFLSPFETTNQVSAFLVKLMENRK